MRLTLVAAFWLALTACAPAIHVTHDWNPDTTPSMAGWKTFSWMPMPEGEDPRIYNDLFNARLHEAIERYLVGRGYSKAEEGAPADFKIAWQGSVDQKLSVSTVNSYYGYGYSGWYGYGYGAMGPSYGGYATDTYIDEYDEGTLIFDIIDGASNELVWRGLAKSELMHYKDQDKRQERLELAISKVFENFPP